MNNKKAMVTGGNPIRSQDLGLVNMKKLLQAIMIGCVATCSQVFLQVSASAANMPTLFLPH